jgi:ppGpp synthetase/RelA/SpoT-type nucleotidyltranferase
MVIAKYLDGVKKFETIQNSYFSGKSVNYKIYFEARDTGYYACHSYLDFVYPVNNQIYQIEIQITTQLQENIKMLTHKYYDKKRRRRSIRSEKWQWEHTLPEFDANYLGHILHYLEAVIVRVRESE